MRILLIPFSVLYGIVTWIRNQFYDSGIFRVYTPPVPSVGIGNLSAGGTGKSPMALLIAEYFSGKRNIVFISRGYGRKTRGFRLAGPDDDASTIGDEPFQVYSRLTGIKVVVDHHRVRAVKRVLSEFPETNLIIFDDIFQHRRIKAGLTILLTEYSRPFYQDNLIPSGRLREYRIGKKRANLIIMTKAPAIFSPIERRYLLQKIGATTEQKVFFSFIKYVGLISYSAHNELIIPLEHFLNKETSVIGFCGIGNPASFEDFIRENSFEYRFFAFADHHEYKASDIQKITKAFLHNKRQQKIILTTEKDMARLRGKEIDLPLRALPFFAIRISPAFHKPDDREIKTTLENYVGQSL